MMTQPTDTYIRVLIYLYAADMPLLLADFGVADKVLRGGCFDDVLGTEVSDVA